MTDDAFQKFLEEEGEAASKGLRPMMGEWRKRFSIPLISSRKGTGQFREKLRAELGNSFFYSGWVQIRFDVFADPVRLMEKGEVADLDNYAKVLCDAIKGPDGILVDDFQITSFNIGWQDHHENCFEIEIRGHPDEFLSKDIRLFEACDGLYYPIQRHEVDGIEARIASFIDASLQVNRGFRNQLEAEGDNRLAAFQRAQFAKPIQIGFPLGKIRDSGFELVKYRDWFDPEKHSLEAKFAGIILK